MEFFVNNAYAQGSGAAAPGMGDFVFLILLFVIFYFLLLRPQMKKAKQHRKLVSELSKGDEVVTVGGVLGRITNVGDDFITLEIAEGLEVKVQRQSVAAAMPKGTIKAA